MSWLRPRRYALAALAFALAFVSPASAGVLPVSPGVADRLVEVSSACPAFSWTGVDGAVAYELAVLDVTDGENPVLVFSERIDGSAYAWTPSRDRCLAPGRTYAWLVRADVAGGGLGEWSAPRRFRVPGVPSLEEVDAALALLERWRVAQPVASGTASGAAVIPAAARSAAATSETDAPLATGVAAIRGEIPDTTGSAYGVFGITHSAAGAGVVARNEAVGPDLVLDGAANAAVDTLVRHDSIDRPAATQQKFDFLNSLGGGLDLRVNGTPVSLDGHVHAGEEIASGTVAEARIAASLARDGEIFSIVLAQDGSGSALDADKLDGLDAAAFLKLSGGTMTGALDMGDNSVSNVPSLQLAPRASPPVCSNGVIYYSSYDALCVCISGSWEVAAGSGTCD